MSIACPKSFSVSVIPNSVQNLTSKPYSTDHLRFCHCLERENTGKLGAAWLLKTHQVLQPGHPATSH